MPRNRGREFAAQLPGRQLRRLQGTPGSAARFMYPNGAPLGLAAGEVTEGLILMCQARARTDLSLETFDVQPANEVPPRKRLPCRIERAIPLSHDVMGLFLRLPIAEEFKFEAGQYHRRPSAGRPAPKFFHCIAAARCPPTRAARSPRCRRRVHRPPVS